MAGDWIKMGVNLDTDPAVLEIAAQLNMEECVVVGRLWKLWSWADQHVTDNYRIAVTRAGIDRVVGVAGFADAMAKTTWLSGEDGALSMPNLERHQGNNAKKRASDRERAARYRERKHHAAVTPASRKRHAALTSESHAAAERREEKSIPPVVPQGDSEPDLDFVEFWQAYPNKAKRKDAAKAWRQVAPHRPALPEILAALDDFKASSQWVKDDGAFIPHASSWLRGQRWTEVQPSSSASENPQKKENGGAAPPDEALWRAALSALYPDSDPTVYASWSQIPDSLRAEILAVFALAEKEAA